MYALIKILGEEGRWERNGCTLTQDGITGVVLCTCQQQGTYAIVRVTQGKTHTNKYNHYGLELLHAENKCSVD